MNKTRPTPLGATSKRNPRLGWVTRSDIAPNGANRVLSDRGYKDFAPSELGRPIVTHPNSCGLFFVFLAIFLDRHNLGDVCCGYPKPS